jgi:hypothetical protein
VSIVTLSIVCAVLYGSEASPATFSGPDTQDVSDIEGRYYIDNKVQCPWAVQRYREDKLPLIMICVDLRWRSLLLATF